PGTPTNEKKPIWFWGSVIGCSAYRYQLGSENGEWTTLDVSKTFWSPDTELADGVYTLYVQAKRMDADWTNSGFCTVEIVSGKFSEDIPIVEVVNGTPTNNQKPTWIWGVVRNSIGYRYQLDNENGEWTNVEASQSSFTPFDKLSEGSYTLYVQSKRVDGSFSKSGFASVDIIVGQLSENIPIVEVLPCSPTNEERPTWVWGTVLNAVGYRCQLETEVGEWSEISANKTFFRPEKELTEGKHILFVQAKRVDGSFSPSGFCEVVIKAGEKSDDIPKVEVVPQSPTQVRKPTWMWGSVTNAVAYRYQLDSENGSWTELSNLKTSWSPQNDLEGGIHTLYVQAQKADSSWSKSGFASVEIVVLEESSSYPIVEVLPGTPTNNPLPTWIWSNVTNAIGYRYQFGSEMGDWTNVNNIKTYWSPQTELTEGSYTLFVQAKFIDGSYSISGAKTVDIHLGKKSGEIPVVEVLPAPKTVEKRPTWIWGEVTNSLGYRYQLDSESGEWINLNSTINSFKPFADFTQGFYTLYVQSRKIDGTWSASGYATVEIIKGLDSDSVPVVDVLPGKYSCDQKPTWIWGTVTNAIGYRCQLNTESGEWIELTSSKL
ncbi:MAG TPA: triple tyrosine motif-containing protein, partial [Spirochaetota bacterium]|nr:triple tyrosine motif-containing protein [Spirochaetota bacterium]